jgi:hypothetical protein
MLFSLAMWFVFETGYLQCAYQGCYSQPGHQLPNRSSLVSLWDMSSQIIFPVRGSDEELSKEKGVIKNADVGRSLSHIWRHQSTEPTAVVFVR